MLRISAGLLKGRQWPVVKSTEIRPMTHMLRLAVFQMLDPFINWPETTVLDAFCGSGILGVEAISRGAKKVHFWDHMKQTLWQIQKNWKTLKLPESQMETRSLDILKALPKIHLAHFQLMFWDPPFKLKSATAAILEKLSSQSDIPSHTVCVVQIPKTESVTPPRGWDLVKSKNLTEKWLWILIRK